MKIKMRTTDQEKICISCEGRIPIATEICPYCATDQTGSKMHNSFQAPIFQNQSLEESLTSLYTPPYQGKRPQFGQTAPEGEREVHSYEDTQAEDPFTAQEIVEDQKETSSFWPTLFFLFGINLLMLGFLQLLFSKNGVLHLEFNAKLWFLYFLFGGPLVYFGYKFKKNA